MAAGSDVTVNLKVKVGSSPQEVLALARQMGVLSGSIKDVEKASRGAGPSVGQLTQGVFQGNLAFFTLRGILTQVRSGFSDFTSAVQAAAQAASDQQAANTQLDNTLRNVGESASGLREQIISLSSQYQKLTGVGDEVIVNSQRQLVAFGATTENIERVTKAALDLSTAMGKDLNSATLLIGKALQGQFATLSRFGIVVDEGATKAQKLEQALKIIEARFGGSAVAQAQNYTGQLGILNQMLAELQESFGNSIVLNANFVNSLRGANGAIGALTADVDGLQSSLQKVTTGALKAFADLLPTIVEKGIEFAKFIADAIGFLVGFTQAAVGLMTYLGGLRKTLEAAAFAILAYRTVVILATAATISLGLASAATERIFKKTTFGAVITILLQLAVVILAATGALDFLGKKFLNYFSDGSQAASVTDSIKQAMDELAPKLKEAAEGFKGVVDESVKFNNDFEQKIKEFIALKKTLDDSQLNQPTDRAGKSLIRPSEVEAAKALQEQLDLLRIGLFAIKNAADEAGVELQESFYKAAAAAGVILGLQGPPDPGLGRVPPAKDKPKGNDALKTLKEEIEATKLEIQVRKEGLEVGRLLAETDILVAEGKNKVKTGSEEEAKALSALKIQLIEINKAEEDLRKVQEQLVEGPRQIEELKARAAALANLNTATLTEVEIKEALAVAQAKVDAGRVKGLLAADKERLITEAATKAQLEYANSVAESAAQEDARRNKSQPAQEKELELLAMVREGVLSLEEAEIKLAVARAEQLGQNGALAEAEERRLQAIDKLRKKIEDTTIDLGKSFDNILDGLVDGILQGTNKGLNVMDIFKRSGQALFGDMLKGMLKDKLGFDQKFSANFLRDLPGIVAKGGQLIGGIWSSLMNSMSGGGGSGQGFWGSLVTGVGSLLGGGGAASGVGTAINVGTAVAGGGSGSGILSNTSTMVSLLRSLYSGVTTFTQGGTIGASLNAAFGGFLTPILDGISSIAPSIGSFLGGGSSAAAAVGGGFSGVSGGAGFSGYAIGGLTGVAPATTVASTLSTIITVAAPYLAMIGGIIATNTGVASLLNSDVFDRAFTLKDRRDTADAGWLDNFVQNAIAQATTLGVVQKGESQLEAAQKTFRGEGSAGDIVQTILQVFTNLPQLIVAAFATSLPTGGTATRAAFEDWIEDARKHQKRAFNPFFGSVPVIDPATNEFVSATGKYDRNLGQGLIRDRLTQKYGSDKDTPDGAFVETMRELIFEEGKLLGLTEKNTKSAIALSVAFKSVSLGDKGGDQIQRYLANALELLANLRDAGASAALSMQFIRFEIARLGDPAKVFQQIGDELKAGNLEAQDYRDTIAGLANVYFRVTGSAKDLEFDLSDKNGKGLDVAAEQLEAIKGIIQDVPVGVRAFDVAVTVLNRHIDEMGEQGAVTFSELKEAIDAAAASANQINPLILEFAQTIAKGASQAIKDGMEATFTEAAVSVFVQTLGRQIEDQVTQGLTNAFIGAQLNTGILGDLSFSITEATDKYNASAQTPDDLATFTKEVQAAGLEAIATIKAMGPALREFAKVMLDVGKAFDDALISETADDVVSLAQAIYQLGQAQKAFNDELDARIYALRNEGQADPEIIRRPLADIEKEFKLTLLGFFGSMSDIIAAQDPNSDSPFAGLITKEDAPAFLRRLPGQANEPTNLEKLAALGTMRELAEKDLAIRIASYQAVGAAEIQLHNDNIKHLQDQREALQEYYADAIEMRQDELELIQEQIEKASKWKDVLDSISQTIFDLETGNSSPFSPTARLSIAEEEFKKQQAIFSSSDSTDEERQRAAEKLTQLGPQLLELLQSTGASQSSESFAAYFDRVLEQLRNAEAYSQEQINAATGGKSIEELTAEATDLQKEIKDLQKEQRDKLRDIDDSIKAEQDAIEAVQERVRKQIEVASKNTADVLEWIKGKGNEVFKDQTDKLKEKLQDLGVDSANIYDMQTNSWLELISIRQILEGEGIKVVNEKPPSTEAGSGKGMFGQSEKGQKEVEGMLSKLSPYGNSIGLLKSLVGKDRDYLDKMIADNRAEGKWVEQIYRIFPETQNSLANFTTVLDAMIKKIQDPGTYSPVLGYALGGIVTRPTYAMIGEGGQSEAIVPMNRLLDTMKGISDRIVSPYLDVLTRLGRQVESGQTSMWRSDQQPSYGLQRPSPIGDKVFGEGCGVHIDKIEIHTEANADIHAEGGINLGTQEGQMALKRMQKAWLLEILDDATIIAKMQKKMEPMFSRTTRRS